MDGLFHFTKLDNGYVSNIVQKNKTIFLLKKIQDYQNRIHTRKSWSLHAVKDYEKKWRYLNHKYSQVNIYGIEFVGIGETIPRLFMYLRDHKKRDHHIFHLVMPTFFPYYTSGIVNHQIFGIFGKYIHFITEDNISFWKYVFATHANKININYFDTYQYRGRPQKFNIQIGKSIIPFSDRMEAYAKDKMMEMGINRTYICLHAREVATKTNNFGDTYEVKADTSVLDCDINSFTNACAYLNKLGYQTVRMGKDESKKCNIDYVIDYANKFYDEFMDFYLIANCKFFIGSSGLAAITSFWGRPVLQINTVGFCYGMESLPWTKYDLYLPKKFYSRRKKRFLNLLEMMDASYKCDRYKMRYLKEEIELIDNTGEEILNAVKEMNEKLDHTWIQTEEEIHCMDRYWHLLDFWKSRHKTAYESKENGGKGFVLFQRSICYSYLKENLYLLDMENLYEK